MPTISAPANILVTGANGYLGLWIVRVLLDRGFSVKGTVRSPAVADSITQFIKEMYPEQTARFQCVVVPDITIVSSNPENPETFLLTLIQDGAFDDAITDVAAVIHTASPVLFAEEDPEACIGPAVRGTVSILHSVLKHGFVPLPHRSIARDISYGQQGTRQACRGHIFHRCSNQHGFP